AARPDRPPVRGGPRPPIRTPQGFTPLLRLVGLIAFAIVIVLLLVYAVEGCQSSSKHAKYQNYMTKVSQIASNSHSIGTRLVSLLEAPALRLLASDVVWDDSFKDPAKQVLRDQGVGDVRVPDSNFVQNPDFFTAAGLGAVVSRLRGANVSPTVGGLHGTNIVSTKALPKGTELSTSQRLPIAASTSLGFAVTVEDSGDSAEVHIPVTLTITNGTKSIERTQTIAFIDKKAQTTVTFRNIQLDSVFFASQSTTVKVKVNPVPNEHNITNNSAEYPVIFSLQ